MFIRQLNEETIPFIARKTRVTRERLLESLHEADIYNFVYYLRFDHYTIQSMKVMQEHLNQHIHESLLEEKTWIDAKAKELTSDIETTGLGEEVAVAN